MRRAKLSDGWRRVLENNRYPLRIDSIILKNILGFENGFSLKFSSGLSAICGKNGVGKSTLLNLMYQKLKFNTIDHYKFCTGADVGLTVHNEKSTNLSDKVFYLDPSAECTRIIDYIKNTANFDELLEGVEPSHILNKDEVRLILSKVVGKRYKSIKHYELDSVLEDDSTLPYFEVELFDGTQYPSSQMGLGEHLCIYLFWFANWIEKESILFIEEIENYLSAYSQEGLIDYLAYNLSDRKVWTILTSHSEHILNKVGLEDISIIYSRESISKNVKLNKSREYFRALGLGEKILGAYLVEDYCAHLFLKKLILTLCPAILDSREIVSLRCDSNLEKMIKHFEPDKKIDYDFFTVFDADQSEKIHKLNKYNIPVAALPSKLSLNPEEEIWQHMNLNLKALSEELSCDFSRLDEFFEDNQTSDHHDRFYNIASSLKISYEALISACISVWLKDEENYNLSKFLILSLLLRNDFKSEVEVNMIFRGIGTVDNDLINEFGSSRVRFLFNGMKYIFEKEFI
tara:strand:+ start:22845 stop:24392 length:1548 start_codon:yes stop_codon:yes gene_type:complete